MSKTAFKFTAAAIERLKPPAAGRVDYSNTAIPGMQLRLFLSKALGPPHLSGRGRRVGYMRPHQAPGGSQPHRTA